MATATPTRRRHRAKSRAQLSARVSRPPLPRPGREERLAGARAQEVQARRELAHAFATMERRYALALRSLDAFDAYLSGVRQRLQKAGYLGASRHCGRAQRA